MTFTFDTSLFGKVTVTRAELYELHREVAKAASDARLDDPQYVAAYDAGVAVSRRWSDAARKASARLRT